MLARLLRIAAIAVAALAVSALALYSYLATRTPPAMVGIIAAAGSASLEATDQVGPADTIVVRRVLAPGAAWVAVYLIGAGGVPTRRVGLVRVPAGESLGVVVPIDPRQALTDKLLVALQADLGVADTFEFDPAHPEEGADKPYVAGGVELSKPVFVRAYGMDAGNMPGGGMGAPMPGGKWTPLQCAAAPCRAESSRPAAETDPQARADVAPFHPTSCVESD